MAQAGPELQGSADSLASALYSAGPTGTRSQLPTISSARCLEVSGSSSRQEIKMLQRASSCCYFSFCSLSAPRASTLPSPPHTLLHSTQTQATRRGSLQAREHSMQNSSVPDAERLQLTLTRGRRGLQLTLTRGCRALPTHTHVDTEASLTLTHECRGPSAFRAVFPPQKLLPQ